MYKLLLLWCILNRATALSHYPCTHARPRTTTSAPAQPQLTKDLPIYPPPHHILSSPVFRRHRESSSQQGAGPEPNPSAYLDYTAEATAVTAYCSPIQSPALPPRPPSPARRSPLVASILVRSGTRQHSTTPPACASVLR
jgi:hypothetical protein